MRRVGLHHVDIVVTSLEREPADLSRAAPAARVHVCRHRGGRARGDSSGTSTEKGSELHSVSERRRRSASGEIDRYAVGLHHIAFEASSREMVDERFQWARERGLEIENEPQEWPYVPWVLRDVLPGSGRDQARGRLRPIEGRACPALYRSSSSNSSATSGSRPISSRACVTASGSSSPNTTTPKRSLASFQTHALGGSSSSRTLAKLLDRRLRVVEAPDQDANEHGPCSELRLRSPPMFRS